MEGFGVKDADTPAHYLDDARLLKGPGDKGDSGPPDTEDVS